MDYGTTTNISRRKAVVAAALLLATCQVNAKPKESKNPQKLGHLLIEVVSVTSPDEVNKKGFGMPRKPSEGHYFVSIHVKIKNLDRKLALCASLKSTLKEEFGLQSQFPIGSVPQVSQLLPGEEIEGDFVFLLKKGVRPLEFALDPIGERGYNEGCRSNTQEEPLKDTIHDLGRWPTSVQSVHFVLKEIMPSSGVP